MSQRSCSNPGETRANAGRNKDGGEVADALREKRAVFGEPLIVENDETAVPSRSRTPHEMIRAMASPGSPESIRAHIFFQAPSAFRMEAERNRIHWSDFS
jgi:hypothetical protein